MVLHAYSRCFPQVQVQLLNLNLLKFKFNFFPKIFPKIFFFNFFKEKNFFSKNNPNVWALKYENLKPLLANPNLEKCYIQLNCLCSSKIPNFFSKTNPNFGMKNFITFNNMCYIS